MHNTLLRLLIREIIQAESGGPAVASASDPTDAKGFYPYELSKLDIQSKWYRSPAQSMGSSGDPGRPEDAASYIGLKPKDAPAETEGAETNDVSTSVKK